MKVKVLSGRGMLYLMESGFIFKSGSRHFYPSFSYLSSSRNTFYAIIKSSLASRNTKIMHLNGVFSPCSDARLP